MDKDLPALAAALERELGSRAERCNWVATPSAQLLRASDEGDAIETLLAALPDAPTEVRSPDRLPDFRRAIELQPASIGLLICGLDAVKPEDSYRAALWWTGLVRANIAPSRRSDLHLFLIAPKGTHAQAEWQGRRSRIESDERFCRKFVWLPSLDPNRAELETFLDRTFLAQPWVGDSAEPRSLDPLERLVEETSSNSLSRDEARGWVARLGSADVSGMQQIAEDLVGILEGKP
jgi:hypothetical protein